MYGCGDCVDVGWFVGQVVDCVVYDQWWFGWVDDDDCFVFVCVVDLFDCVGCCVCEFVDVFVCVGVD